MPRTIKRETGYERERRRWVEQVEAVETPTFKPVVEGLLRRGELRRLVGPRWSGKTAIAARLAAAVSRGDPFQERATWRTNVLFLATDRGPAEWVHEMRSIVGATDRWFRVGFGPLGLERPEGLWELRARIEDSAVGLVVVDPLEEAVGRRCFGRALVGLETILREKNVAGLVVGEAATFGVRGLWTPTFR